ncbi:hypothetical protein [Paenibacillus jiagnxiensis]|uniref:hypothetical protein n=1 Tax=Paenibacillus jiagnxiensis TaxID=3228926 RepID=UPI0033A413CD
MKKLLVAGNRPILRFLIPSLLQAIPESFSILITEDCPSSQTELDEEMNEMLKGKQSEGRIMMIKKDEMTWRELVQPFHFVLFASANNKLELYHEFYSCCIEEQKVLLPLTFTHEYGILGPATIKESDACWESCWRRLHMQKWVSSFPAPTIVNMMSHITSCYVERYLRTGIPELQNRVYILSGDPIHGEIHSFFEHPLTVQHIPLSGWFSLHIPFKQEQSSMNEEQLQDYFTGLVSSRIGVFYSLEESSFDQLPLSLCSIQTADPLADGPSTTLPTMIHAGMDHNQARREAGLSGLEGYVSRLCNHLFSKQMQNTYAGVGTTASEAAGRGLQSLLQSELDCLYQRVIPAAVPFDLSKIDDLSTKYYLESLRALAEDLVLGYSEDLYPHIPIVWVRSNGTWHYAIDLNPTLALRRVLAEALGHIQTGHSRSGSISFKTISLAGQTKQMCLPEAGTSYRAQDIEDMLSILHPFQVLVTNLAVEPFLKELVVFGVRLSKEVCK